MNLYFLLSRTISSGFGSGFSPFASGTAGSALACVAWWVAIAPFGSPTLTLVVALGTFALGTHATHVVINNEQWLEKQSEKVRRKGHLDPGEVVVDEWAGMFFTLIPLALFPESPQLPGLAVGFVLFRCFDVFKPGPIGKAEKLPGAIGIMLDDLVAGAFSAIFLALFLWAF